MVQGIFSWVDLVMTPLWLLLLYLIAYAISHIKYKDSYLRKHFMLGLTAKFIGCFGFIALYAIYYGSGDTFRYFLNADKLMGFVIDNPSQLLHVLTSTNLNYSEQINIGLDTPLLLNDTSSNYMVIRFTLLFGFFTFNSYLATSLFFAFGSFIGIWALYRVVVYLFPHQYKAITLPILYFPSVFFWGSSIMKDSIVIGFVGLLTYAIYQLYFRHHKILLNFLLMLLSAYILANVKQYVIIAFVPALIFWMTLGPINKLAKSARMVLTPLLFIVALAIITISFPFVEKVNQQYAIEHVLETAEKTANYIHRTTREGGSSYSLGKISYTPLGILMVFPRAGTVTLYQPFFYQVRNPVMLLSALESTLILLGTLYVLFSMGFLRYIKYIIDNPFLFLCLLFSIFFSFAIGLSTFNFGSLVRYKIPALPFYGIAIIIPYMLYRSRIPKSKK